VHAIVDWYALRLAALRRLQGHRVVHVRLDGVVIEQQDPVEAIGFLFAYVINQITLRLKRRVKLQSQTLFVTISLLERMRGREPHISLLIFPTLDYVPVYGIIYCSALRVSTSATYYIRIAHFSHFLNTGVGGR
jgi:hypothetical protein